MLLQNQSQLFLFACNMLPFFSYDNICFVRDEIALSEERRMLESEKAVHQKVLTLLPSLHCKPNLIFSVITGAEALPVRGALSLLPRPACPAQQPLSAAEHARSRRLLRGLEGPGPGRHQGSGRQNPPTQSIVRRLKSLKFLLRRNNRKSVFVTYILI